MLIGLSELRSLIEQRIALREATAERHWVKGHWQAKGDHHRAAGVTSKLTDLVDFVLDKIEYEEGDLPTRDRAALHKALKHHMKHTIEKFKTRVAAPHIARLTDNDDEKKVEESSTITVGDLRKLVREVIETSAASDDVLEIVDEIDFVEGDEHDEDHDERRGGGPADYEISEGEIEEVAPPGWEGTVKAMKKHPKKIDNPFALAWSMKNKGAHPHKKEQKK